MVYAMCSKLSHIQYLRFQNEYCTECLAQSSTKLHKLNTGKTKPHDLTERSTIKEER